MRAFALGFALGVVLTATTGILLLRRGIVPGVLVSPALSAAVESASLDASSAELETVPDEGEETEAPPESEAPPEASEGTESLEEEEESEGSGSFLSRFFNSKKSSSEAPEEKQEEKEGKPSLLARLKGLLPGKKGSDKAAEPPAEPSGPGEMLELGAYPSEQVDFLGGEYHIWDGLLFVEAENSASGNWNLFCFDMDSGEQLFTLPMEDGGGNRSELRQNFDKPGGFFIFTADERREYDGDGNLLSTYLLPDSVRMGEDGPIENPYQNIYGVRWDVLPERNLLVWCDPEGVWAADLEGNNVILAGDWRIFNMAIMNTNLEIRYRYNEKEPWDRLIPRAVRIMEDGGWLSVEFGTPLYTRNHLLLARIPYDGASFEEWLDNFENRNDATKIHDVSYFVGLPGSDDTDYPDKHTVQAGYARFDMATGEGAEAARWDFANGYPAVTENFVTYYGVKETDTDFLLYRYNVNRREDARLFLVLPKEGKDESYQEFSPLVVEEDRVVCRYSTAGETGLMLVTTSEE